MSTNITIQEGGKEYQFSVASMRTDVDGGGTCLWVPPGGGNVKRKHITKNGIYVAGDEGYYAYSVVTVNVDRNKGVTGRSTTDGKEHHISVNPETGELEDTVVPTEIRVVVQPDYVGPYYGGDTITVEGMVVNAFGADGAYYDYIPLSDLFFPVLRVPNIEFQDYMWYEGMTYYKSTGAQANLGILKDYGLGWDLRYVSAYIPTGMRFIIGSDTGNGFVVCAISLEPFSSGLRYGKADASIATSYPYPNTSAGSYGSVNYSGTTYYYGFMTVSAQGVAAWEMHKLIDRALGDNVTSYARKAVEACYGPNARGGGNMAVPVKWSRPGDGEVLSTNFVVEVRNREEPVNE